VTGNNNTLIGYNTSMSASYILVKAGEGNPQAREEEGKTFIRPGAQLISGWNSWNLGIGILWESRLYGDQNSMGKPPLK